MKHDNTRIRIANLVCDRRLMKTVFERHNLMGDKCVHHYFFIYKKSNYKFKNIKTDLDKIIVMSADEFLKLCDTKEYDAVFLHALDSFPYNKIALIPKSIKVFWFAWGFDLYGHPFKEPMIRMNLYKEKTLLACPYLRIDSFLSRSRNVLKWCRDILRGTHPYSSVDYIRAVSRIDYFSGVLPCEFDLIKSVPYFHAKKVFYAYFGVKGMLESIPDTVPLIGNNILVGNSAAETNNHLDILEYIKDVNIQNRSLISALSYAGPKSYIKKVVIAYKSVFGDNYKPLLQLMSGHQYSELLRTCGFGIFYHERQKGMGNINRLIMQGAKVFLSETSIAYLYYKEIGLNVFSVQRELNAESLSKPLTNEEKMNNITILGSTKTKKARLKLLDDLYDIIRNDCSK